MQNGSHSRHSYPADKPLPKGVAHQNPVPTGDVTTVQRKVMKAMHHSKARQHDKQLSTERED